MEKGILAAVSDVFFAAKLQAMAKRAERPLVTVRSVEAIEEKRAEPFGVFVVDLESKAFEPVDAIQKIRALWPDADIWAFAAHEHKEKLMMALRHGAATAVPRGVFESRFPRFLEGKVTGSP
jgi:DNA-binding NarL/FixJ family response regulator